jgi:hypothetical protein
MFPKIGTSMETKKIVKKKFKIMLNIIFRTIFSNKVV